MVYGIHTHTQILLSVEVIRTELDSFTDWNGNGKKVVQIYTHRHTQTQVTYTGRITNCIHARTQLVELWQWVFICSFEELQKNIQEEEKNWAVQVSMKKGASDSDNNNVQVKSNKKRKKITCVYA